MRYNLRCKECGNLLADIYQNKDMAAVKEHTCDKCYMALKYDKQYLIKRTTK